MNKYWLRNNCVTCGEPCCRRQCTKCFHKSKGTTVTQMCRDRRERKEIET